jgi:rSAM/selenodomain-associated transferase 2
VIVPVLNEAGTIAEMLAALVPLRTAGHEVWVVDGGSTDGTHALAEAAPCVAGAADTTVLASPQGRAAQMNAGARAAGGDVFLFLHADTRLPMGAAAAIIAALAAGAQWGRFDVRLSGKLPIFRVIAALMNIRSRWTGIATGDQAIFVHRVAFAAVGGFPEIPLMEDIALSALLRRLGPPACLRLSVTTSSRRWEAAGVARATITMWGLRLAYFSGADPHRLKGIYDRLR